MLCLHKALENAHALFLVEALLVKGVVELVHLGDIKAMREDERRVEFPGNDVVVQDLLHVLLNGRLSVSLEHDALFHQGADVEAICL